MRAAGVCGEGGVNQWPGEASGAGDTFAGQLQEPGFLQCGLFLEVGGGGVEGVGEDSREHGMIDIEKSATADTRTCDFANVTKEQLLASSLQHIGDVVKALAFFSGKLTEAAGEHDFDKLTAIDWFHSDFVTGFRKTGWWDNHRRIHRHHIDKMDGVPADVNLVDVLEHIADCVMAGMARSGSVYELKLSDELLQKAFQNTVELLRGQVSIKSPAS